MREVVEKTIQDLVKEYPDRKRTFTRWKNPLVGFASSEDPFFPRLKKIVSPDHIQPGDLLSGARTVISYFIPFSEEVVFSNTGSPFCSREWALAYIETNELIGALNAKLKEILEKPGYKVALVPATHNFSEETLLSTWSHRHIAFLSGLGNFGMNNMLITEKGCCGRLGSLVTDLKVRPSNKKEKPFCLYKAGRNCLKCFDRCPVKALKPEGFDRWTCYEFLLKNDLQHSDLGLVDACGKCCAGLPCSLENPVGEG